MREETGLSVAASRQALSLRRPSPLDNDLYFDRREERANEAEAQRDALVGQNVRRYKAIMEAVRRIGVIKKSLRARGLANKSLVETLDEITSALEKANQVRAQDAGEDDEESSRATP